MMLWLEDDDCDDDDANIVQRPGRLTTTTTAAPAASTTSSSSLSSAPVVSEEVIVTAVHAIGARQWCTPQMIPMMVQLMNFCSIRIILVIIIFVTSMITMGTATASFAVPPLIVLARHPQKSMVTSFLSSLQQLPVRSESSAQQMDTTTNNNNNNNNRRHRGTTTAATTTRISKWVGEHANQRVQWLGRQLTFPPASSSQQQRPILRNPPEHDGTTRRLLFQMADDDDDDDGGVQQQRMNDNEEYDTDYTIEDSTSSLTAMTAKKPPTTRIENIQSLSTRERKMIRPNNNKNKNSNKKSTTTTTTSSTDTRRMMEEQQVWEALANLEKDMQLLDRITGNQPQLSAWQLTLLLSAVGTTACSPFIWSGRLTEFVAPSMAAFTAAIGIAAEYRGKVAVADGKEVAAASLQCAAEAEGFLASAERAKAVRCFVSFRFVSFRFPLLVANSTCIYIYIYIYICITVF
jgi:hypothetical protein